MRTSARRPRQGDLLASPPLACAHAQRGHVQRREAGCRRRAQGCVLARARSHGARIGALERRCMARLTGGRTDSSAREVPSDDLGG
eukprot:6203915-Pleurochrysis_carterae.AAC.2